ncbi:lipopolysaccharide-induced tumor necrosis factor-alpha factor homolog [Aricia agestis]|uniref:lipopolysaccharide-induced tumor necrosis factor-alpha factor homolog n=1 Tax=Aricia agestis TaxID=91739 RepID=UPI001C20B498|nr:lipopolysaccharide-induced tumor necrosis factor-alpha factor homolog [Aricia agestis]XP_041972913.1 lipopolysaccharide-induced tumor necrosis factor-alpha factor homolog [Aricia agestis]
MEMKGPPPPAYDDGPPGPPGPPGGVPPQPGYYGFPTIIVETPMGAHPTPYTCRSCNQQIVTRIERKNVMKTHLFALLLCVFGCWPCVCIPYCVDSCKSADHYCPNCNGYIGRYQD